MTRIALWVPDLQLQDPINSILLDAGFEVTLIDQQNLANTNIEDWEMLFLDKDVFEEVNIQEFLRNLRSESECKVIILAKFEFYPVIGTNRYGIDEWVEWALYYPITESEILGNIKRYLGHS